MAINEKDVGEDKMNQGLMTRYIEVGFPHLKETSKLPEWLIPRLPEVASQLGDESLLELAEPLALKKGIKSFLAQAPEADKLPTEIWREGICGWYVVHQVMPVTMALMRACEKVEALERRGLAGINSAATVRGLATIAFAIFTPNGGKILDRLAGILGGSPAEPAALLNLYVEAMENGDKDTLTGVEECVLQDPAWTEWFKRFFASGTAFPFVPKVVGVSLVPTSELIQLLGAMIKEVIDADNRRDPRN